MIEIIYSFCLGVCVGIVGTNIYETKKMKKLWHKATLGLTDFDIKCINEEESERLTMTNGEKYAGSTHNQYVYERMCPKCDCFVCGREPSDFRECLIKDVRDYREWLLREADND